MFLRAQHFQQQDRFVEALVRGASRPLRAYAYGFVALDLNRELLAQGRIALVRADGILPDGTPFRLPEDAPHPPPLEVREGTRNAVVHLALPIAQPGGVEVDPRQDGDTNARFGAAEYQAADANAGNDSVVPVRVGRMRLRLMLDGEDRAGYATLGVARVVEVRPDKTVVLDERYIPPALDIAASAVLVNLVKEWQGLLRQRAAALAGRVSGGGRGVAEVADFLFLQAINRFEPVVSHFDSAALVHPEDLYQLGLSMAGEFATFTAKTRRSPEFPAYRHDDLQATFQPVIEAMRQAMSAVMEQAAVPIALQERKYGIRVATVADRSLLVQAAFVLVVKADLPAEALRRSFPNQIKIGPVEQIRELVNAQLPGIRLRPLPVAPRQIPFYANATYFELEQASPLWTQLQATGNFAMHVAGDFPGLQMEFWAIRS